MLNLATLICVHIDFDDNNLMGVYVCARARACVSLCIYVYFVLIYVLQVKEEEILMET